METDLNISKDDVIAKIKDDGDFDRLRLMIIRKLKDNEELREKIILAVKESKAINCAVTENLKPRQLSDAIHEEVGNKIMAQISDGLWEIIRSPDGMKNEIAETVQSVYDKMVNPKVIEVGETSSPCYVDPLQKEVVNNGSHIMPTYENDGTLSDNELNEPPGFAFAEHSQNESQEQINKELLQPPQPREKSPTSKGDLDSDNVQFNVPPDLFSKMEGKPPSDHCDEDPDLPPGFG